MSTASRPQHQRAVSLNGIEAQQTLLKRRDKAAVDHTELLEDDLNAIGFGSYHLRLMCLCGLGWLSDNATLQCIAVILPRVQVHYNLSSTDTSLLSASAMAGMAVGAYSWGSIADSTGRTLPYHATILLTGIFNLGASYSSSFGSLCIWMFAVGTAVGGSMPTDGTLFLENLPLSKQYLLTSLSTFFAFGAVMSSVIGLLVLPGASCAQAEGCDVAGGANDGWKKMLFVLALLDFAMVIARSAAFRLHESPRYLVASRRKEECAKVLGKIAHFNKLVDFTPSVGGEGSLKRLANVPIVLFEAPAVDRRPVEIAHTPPPHARMTSSARLETKNTPLYGHKLSSSLSSSNPPGKPRNPFFTPSEELGQPDWEGSDGRRTPSQLRHSVDGVKRASIEEEGEELNSDDEEERGLARKDGYISFKERLMTGLDDWGARFAVLFGAQWRLTFFLMVFIWMTMALAYGMFNVWLPTVLEQRSRDAGKGLYDALLEYVWFSIAGIPGSIFGGWLIETRLGRRKSLALSTVLTACMCLVFSQTTSRWAEVLSTCMLSNAAVTMYAILYGMTPETFTTSLRGTAVGFLAASSRIAGIAAPIVAGSLLARQQSLPLICSAIVFASTAICAVFLPFERAPGTRSSGAVSMAH